MNMLCGLNFQLWSSDFASGSRFGADSEDWYWTDYWGVQGIAWLGACTHAPTQAIKHRSQGHAQDLDGEDACSHIFASVPGPLQTVQRAKYGREGGGGGREGVLVAFQTVSGIHVDIGNLNVPQRVARLIDKGLEAPASRPSPFPFLSDQRRWPSQCCPCHRCVHHVGCGQSLQRKAWCCWVPGCCWSGLGWGSSG